MNACDIVGFTADADTFCADCAREMYGRDQEGRVDHEGNEIRPTFVNEACDLNELIVCGRCGLELWIPEEE
jgi:hypothetical protein